MKFENNMEITADGYTRTLTRWTKGDNDRIYINGGSRRGDGYVDLKSRTTNLYGDLAYQVKIAEMILDMFEEEAAADNAAPAHDDGFVNVCIPGTPLVKVFNSSKTKLYCVYASVAYFKRCGFEFPAEINGDLTCVMEDNGAKRHYFDKDADMNAYIATICK